MPEDPVLTQAIRRAAAEQAMMEKARQTDDFIVEKIGIQNAKLLPCPVCGKSKWKTVLRGSAYQCRTCGYQRAADDQESADLPA